MSQLAIPEWARGDVPDNAFKPFDVPEGSRLDGIPEWARGDLVERDDGGPTLPAPRPLSEIGEMEFDLAAQEFGTGPGGEKAVQRRREDLEKVEERPWLTTRAASGFLTSMSESLLFGARPIEEREHFSDTDEFREGARRPLGPRAEPDSPFFYQRQRHPRTAGESWWQGGKLLTDTEQRLFETQKKYDFYTRPESMLEKFAGEVRAFQRMVGVPEADTTKETISDAVGGLVAFIVKLALIKKAGGKIDRLQRLPAHYQSAIIWEIENQSSGGPLGRGAAMALGLAGIARLKNVRPGIRIALESASFGGLAALHGEDEVDLYIALAIPFALRANKGREAVGRLLRGDKLKSMRIALADKMRRSTNDAEFAEAVELVEAVAKEVRKENGYPDTYVLSEGEIKENIKAYRESLSESDKNVRAQKIRDFRQNMLKGNAKALEVIEAKEALLDMNKKDLTHLASVAGPGNIANVKGKAIKGEYFRMELARREGLKNAVPETDVHGEPVVDPKEIKSLIEDIANHQKAIKEFESVIDKAPDAEVKKVLESMAASERTELKDLEARLEKAREGRPTAKRKGRKPRTPKTDFIESGRIGDSKIDVGDTVRLGKGNKIWNVVGGRVNENGPVVKLSRQVDDPNIDGGKKLKEMWVRADRANIIRKAGVEVAEYRLPEPTAKLSERVKPKDRGLLKYILGDPKAFLTTKQTSTGQSLWQLRYADGVIVKVDQKLVQDLVDAGEVVQLGKEVWGIPDSQIQIKRDAPRTEISSESERVAQEIVSEPDKTPKEQLDATNDRLKKVRDQIEREEDAVNALESQEIEAPGSVPNLDKVLRIAGARLHVLRGEITDREADIVRLTEEIKNPQVSNVESSGQVDTSVRAVTFARLEAARLAEHVKAVAAFAKLEAAKELSQLKVIRERAADARIADNVEKLKAISQLILGGSLKKGSPEYNRLIAKHKSDQDQLITESRSLRAAERDVVLKIIEQGAGQALITPEARIAVAAASGKTAEALEAERRNLGFDREVQRFFDELRSIRRVPQDELEPFEIDTAVEMKQELLRRGFSSEFINSATASKKVENLAGGPEIIDVWHGGTVKGDARPLTHVGTQAAARKVIGSQTNKARALESGRITFSNPVDLKDSGRAHNKASIIAEDLVAHEGNDIDPQLPNILRRTEHTKGKTQAKKELVTYLLNKGYDIIRYRNVNEDKGSLSYITLTQGQFRMIPRGKILAKTATRIGPTEAEDAQALADQLKRDKQVPTIQDDINRIDSQLANIPRIRSLSEDPASDQMTEFQHKELLGGDPAQYKTFTEAEAMLRARRSNLVAEQEIRGKKATSKPRITARVGPDADPVVENDIPTPRIAKRADPPVYQSYEQFREDYKAGLIDIPKKVMQQINSPDPQHIWDFLVKDKRIIHDVDPKQTPQRVARREAIGRLDKPVKKVKVKAASAVFVKAGRIPPKSVSTGEVAREEGPARKEQKEFLSDHVQKLPEHQQIVMRSLWTVFGEPQLTYSALADHLHLSDIPATKGGTRKVTKEEQVRDIEKQAIYRLRQEAGLVPKGETMEENFQRHSPFDVEYMNSGFSLTPIWSEVTSAIQGGLNAASRFLEWESRDMIQNVGTHGGKVGVNTAQIMNVVVDRQKKHLGSFELEQRTAQKRTNATHALRKASGTLQDGSYTPDSGMVRSEEGMKVSGYGWMVRRLEDVVLGHRKPKNKAEAFLIRTARTAHETTGKLLERIGLQIQLLDGKWVPFKRAEGGKTFLTMPTREFYDILLRGPGKGDRLWENLEEGLSELNDLTLSQVRQRLNLIRDVVVSNDPQLGYRHVGPEFAKFFKRRPTDVRATGTNNRSVPILHTELRKYMDAVYMSTATRAGFVEAFGQKGGVVRAIRELYTNAHGNELAFDNAIRTLSDVPPMFWQTSIRNAPISPASRTYDVFRGTASVLEVMKQGFLSATAPIQLSEMFGFGTQMGYDRMFKGILQAMPFAPGRKMIIAELSANRIITRDVISLTIDRTHYLSDFMNKFAGILSRVHMNKMANEVANETVGALQAHAMMADIAQRAIRGEAPSPRDVVFFRDILGYSTPQAVRLASLKSSRGGVITSDEYYSAMRRASRITTGSIALMAEKSPLRNTRAFRFMIPFTSFFSNKFRTLDLNIQGIHTASKEYAAAKKKGDALEISTAQRRLSVSSWQLAKFLGGNLLAGALASYIYETLREGPIDAFNKQGRALREDWLGFLGSTLAWSSFGPVYGAFFKGAADAFKKDISSDEILRGFTRMILPLTAGLEVLDAMKGTGSYVGYEDWSRLGKWTKTHVPILNTPGGMEAAKLLGWHLGLPDTKAAIRNYWQWRFDSSNNVVPASRGSVGSRTHEDRMLGHFLRQAKEAHERGDSPWPFLSKAFNAQGGEVDLESKVNSWILLDDPQMTDEDRRRLQRAIGGKNYEIIRARDNAIRMIAHLTGEIYGFGKGLKREKTRRENIALEVSKIRF